MMRRKQRVNRAHTLAVESNMSNVYYMFCVSQTCTDDSPRELEVGDEAEITYNTIWR